VIGFVELDKPQALQARGGAWFKLDSIEFHLGVEDEFRPAHKAHPAFQWDDLDNLAQRLASAGYPVAWDDLIDGTRRFYSADPFGNRLEFIEPS